MIYFRQLFDVGSSSYTYLLGDLKRHEALLIDPVLEHLTLYLSLLDEQALELCCVLETHVHADHITCAGRLREETGARVMVSEAADISCADAGLSDGDEVGFGRETVSVMATPGHTSSCMSYLWQDRLFTGDALLIGTCGRTDLQGGDPGTLYDSIAHRIWVLPGETLIYPGHDGQHRHVSSVEQERESNPMLSGKSRDEFVSIMSGMGPIGPGFLEKAVHANQRCGNILI